MLSNFLSGIFSAIKNWLSQIWKVVNDAFWWLCFTVFEYMVAIVMACLDFFPPVAKDLAAELVQVFLIAHYWLAIGDALAWVVGYWTFAAIYSLIKICIKLIPFIG